MDLRTRKTLRALREAFVEMRATRPLERVTVRELCERAEISKATFYLHYHSVYDLSAALQADAVDRVVRSLGEADEFLAQPGDLTRRLFEAFSASGPDVDALFSHGQEHALVELVEQGLRRCIFSRRPELADDRRFNVLLAYQVQGSYAAYMRYARKGDEKDRAAVVDAISQASAAVALLW